MKIVFLTSLLFCVSAYSNEISLSFDDAPVGDEYIYSGPERTQKIIEVLKKHQLQTIFYVNTNKLPKSQGAERILAYSKAGHLIGNHTHSHPKLKETPTIIFLKDFDQADEILKTFPTCTKLFRFPFLNEGATIEARDQVRNHLKLKGYQNGYVTVDNYDFYMNDLIQTALEKKQKVNLDKACEMLVDLIWKGIQFYDGVAQKHVGSVRHVLLMHENDLQAHCLDKLITHIKNKKWKIISPEEAYKNPLKEPSTLYLGRGRVAALAHEKSGIEYVSSWENEKSLNAEFNKRKIVEK
jgi:peptidoglycan-N-acetylglucosamine deacetylase